MALIDDDVRLRDRRDFIAVLRFHADDHLNRGARGCVLLLCLLSGRRKVRNRKSGHQETQISAISFAGDCIIGFLLKDNSGSIRLATYWIQPAANLLLLVKRQKSAR